jgi:hypothetical protein
MIYLLGYNIHIHYPRRILAIFFNSFFLLLHVICIFICRKRRQSFTMLSTLQCYEGSRQSKVSTFYFMYTTDAVSVPLQHGANDLKIC